MIRPYREDDSEILENMLAIEGVDPFEMGFDSNETWVYDDEGIKGFYTWEVEHDIFPHLKHLCVKRDSRQGQISRALIKDFRQRMKDKGYKFAFIHARTEQMAKVFEWYFKTKQHSESNGYHFFFVEV